MLAVFLNNKLISCDTILPLAMEVRARSSMAARFYTTDARTYDAIKQNVVLWDAINTIGRLVLLGPRDRRPIPRFLNKLRAGAILLQLAAVALLGRVYFLHFRALNSNPLAFLARMNPRRVFFCESDSYGESVLMKRIAEVIAPRERDSEPPVRGALLAFQPRWVWLHDPEARRLPRYVFGPTRTRRIWLDFVRENGDAYVRRALEAEGHPGDARTIVFMTGYLGPLDYLHAPDSTLRLLRQTLEILAEIAPQHVIVLKPHVITAKDVLDQVVRELRAAGAKIAIANLHPSVLALRATCFIANYYSTTLADAYTMNTPTIEYTDYSARALEVTGGGSMNPDFVSHFINNDPARLRAILKKVLATPRRPAPPGLDGDSSGVLDVLCGRARIQAQPAVEAEQAPTS